MNFIEYWKEFLVFAGLISTYIAGRESKKIQNKKDTAIAEQEQIKVKKEDVSLSILIQESWEKLNKNVFISIKNISNGCAFIYVKIPIAYNFNFIWSRT